MLRNGLTIASSGKGGVGKTSFMALVLKSFLSDGRGAHSKNPYGHRVQFS